jgi:hypothetical protein
MIIGDMTKPPAGSRVKFPARQITEFYEKAIPSLSVLTLLTVTYLAAF